MTALGSRLIPSCVFLSLIICRPERRVLLDVSSRRSFLENLGRDSLPEDAAARVRLDDGFSVDEQQIACARLEREGQQAVVDEHSVAIGLHRAQHLAGTETDENGAARATNRARHVQLLLMAAGEERERGEEHEHTSRTSANLPSFSPVSFSLSFEVLAQCSPRSNALRACAVDAREAVIRQQHILEGIHGAQAAHDAEKGVGG